MLDRTPTSASKHSMRAVASEQPSWPRSSSEGSGEGGHRAPCSYRAHSRGTLCKSPSAKRRTRGLLPPESWQQGRRACPTPPASGHLAPSAIEGIRAHVRAAWPHGSSHQGGGDTRTGSYPPACLPASSSRLRLLKTLARLSLGNILL